VEKEIDRLRKRFLWKGAQREGNGHCLVIGSGFASAESSVAWASLTFEILIRSYCSNGGGNYFRSREGDGHHWCRKITDLSQVGGQTGVLTRRPLPCERVLKCEKHLPSYCYEYSGWEGSRFWEDKWCPMTPLRIFFPELHRVAKDPWDWSKITGKDMVGILRCHGNKKKICYPKSKKCLMSFRTRFHLRRGER